MRKISIIFIVLSVFFIGSCSNAAGNTEKEKSENAVNEVLYKITVSASSNGKITPNKTSDIRAGEEVFLTAEANEGYKLKSLSVSTGEQKDIALAAVSKGLVYKFTMPIGDVTINSEFAINTRTEDITDQLEAGAVLYKIEHWLQDVDDLETYELSVIQTKSGQPGEETTAVAKSYKGFNVLNFSQKTISENGTTVVKIFYNRKTITYTFDPNGGNWDGETQVKTVSGLYGAVVSVENPVKLGYKSTWNEPIPQTFEEVDFDFIASWTARTDTKYTVEIYEQKVEGGNNYTLLSSSEETGITDTITTVTPSNKNGFDFTINQVNIEGDGSAVVKVYYNRKSYTISFDTQGGSAIPDQQILYGAKVQMPKTPTKENYRFCTWSIYKDSNKTFNFNTVICSSMTIYAQWLGSNITYTFHETITKLEDGSVLFGDFPQSEKENNVNIDSTPICFIRKNLTNIEYYPGSDGNFYVPLNYEDFFERKWYKIEPIKWQVISKKDNGKAILLSEKILTFEEYQGRGYSDSTVHDYLNNCFLYEAFTENAIQLIENYKYNDETTFLDYEDKIVLLDRDEVNSLINFSLVKNPTDFACKKGASHWWLLRSYYFVGGDNRYFYSVTGRDYEPISDGNNINRGELLYYSQSGLVPAITVHLPD